MFYSPSKIDGDFCFISSISRPTPWNQMQLNVMRLLGPEMVQLFEYDQFFGVETAIFTVDKWVCVIDLLLL